jgi:addiction module HigA family antidote
MKNCYWLKNSIRLDPKDSAAWHNYGDVNYSAGATGRITGEHLAEELKELGMSAAELARNLDVPTNWITGILNGQRAVTGDTALRLAHFFGTSAEFWLNLQSLYELRIAQKKRGNR